MAAQYNQLLFVATSNFEQAIDEALLSRADLVELIDRPDLPACRAILMDSLSALAAKWSGISKILTSPKLETAVEECKGLDGREIRKAVFMACTFSKDVALDPNQLGVDDLVRSIRQKKEKRK